MKPDKRWKIMGLAWGAGLILLGLVFAGLGGQINTLSCDGATAGGYNCQLEREVFGLVPLNRQRLTGMSAVDLREDCLDGCRYWLELKTATGPVRFTRYASYNRQGVEADKQALEDLMRVSALGLFSYTVGPSWLMLGASLLIIGPGIFLIWISVKKR